MSEGWTDEQGVVFKVNSPKLDLDKLDSMEKDDWCSGYNFIPHAKLEGEWIVTSLGTNKSPHVYVPLWRQLLQRVRCVFGIHKWFSVKDFVNKVGIKPIEGRHNDVSYCIYCKKHRTDSKHLGVEYQK